ncbi:hypothetical protein CRENBAI_007183 [Crenichthys baileyi]|uniref:Uncharacterized protein n=1 Tax=Crenichthys baileyi TaxID=28760 RepID=A0AAV9R2B4_9TELE
MVHFVVSRNTSRSISKALCAYTASSEIADPKGRGLQLSHEQCAGQVNFLFTILNTSFHEKIYFSDQAESRRSCSPPDLTAHHGLWLFLQLSLLCIISPLNIYSGHGFINVF